jgi:hypothetical protein
MLGILLALVATSGLLAGGAAFSKRLLRECSAAERFVAAVVCAFVGIVLATQGLSLFGAIGLTGFLVVAAGFVLFAFVFRESASAAVEDGAWSSELGRWLTAAGFLGVALVCVKWLWRGVSEPVSIDTDGPIYHLPFAVRWLQDGALTRTWTPFGELAATYFPGNGEIWMCWLLATVGDDRLAKVAQWFFLLPAGAALYSLGRAAGGDRWSSIWPALCWSACPFVFYYSSKPNVDLPMAFLLLAGLVFLSRAWRTEDLGGRRGASALSGMAFGAAAGTKSVGLLFAAVPMAVLLWNSRRDRRGAVLAFLAALAGAGFWFARNFWETGNPLYPFRFSAGGVVLFDGWYDAAVMRGTSGYHLPVADLADAWPVLSAVAPPMLWIALAVSFVTGLIAAAVKRDGSRPTIMLCLGLALLWAAEFWFIQPYNTQQRFLLPALAVGFVPLALSRGLWSVLPAALLADPIVREWRRTEFDWRVAVAFVVVAAATMVWIASDRERVKRLVAAIALAALLLLAPTIAMPRSAGKATLFYSTRDFGERLFPAWARIDRSIAADPKAVGVVGYAGTNLPYYLAGPSLGVRFRYVNVQGDADWLPHDHFRRLRETGERPPESAFPQWHRAHPDRDVWLRNLDALKVDHFLVARENYHGRPDAPAGVPPFPIEYEWIISMPERFERLGPGRSPDGHEPWGIAFRVRQSLRRE